MDAASRIAAPAPRFSLPATDGTGTRHLQVSLDNYRGRWLVLLFYPRDFSLI